MLAKSILSFTMIMEIERQGRWEVVWWRKEKHKTIINKQRQMALQPLRPSCHYEVVKIFNEWKRMTYSRYDYNRATTPFKCFHSTIIISLSLSLSHDDFPCHYFSFFLTIFPIDIIILFLFFFLLCKGFIYLQMTLPEGGLLLFAIHNPPLLQWCFLLIELWIYCIAATGQ